MPTRQDLFNFTFEVHGQKQLDRALGLYSANIKDLRGVWPDIRDDFLEGGQAQFASQGKSGSGGWKALSPAYAAWKNAHFPGKPILQRQGDLIGSLTNKSNKRFIYRPSKLGLAIGTRVPYARYHQTGTPDMPARPPIQLTKAQQTRWMKLIQEHIFNTGQGYQRAII
ncbi:MAG: hypothetical protein HOC74_10105 [Gemmatimonadetes bacterium]|jgi:phage gpG-like protein|nr:hypothetical protein [Gemmatimonadota bacterium]